MKFAFLVHPISSQTESLISLNRQGNLIGDFGGDLLQFTHSLRAALSDTGGAPRSGKPQVRLFDELLNLVSATGAQAAGRIYEIPMDGKQILENSRLAMSYLDQAVEEAADWGAELIGLGSMTAVIGGQGTQLAEVAPTAITTGNSLTVFAALENLRAACRAAEFSLEQETLAVVGIPGSIASAAAKILRPQCRELLLVARQDSRPAQQLAERLDAELVLDIPQALERATVVLTATSSGNCIDQQMLRPGSITVDVGVPTDVAGTTAIRDDVLILSGGLASVPDTVPRDSMMLGFHHGVIPSCLGETMVLALDGQAQCYSLGRSLGEAAIQSIGARALAHGFDFTSLFSFGVPLDEPTLIRFRKSLASQCVSGNGRRNGQPAAEPVGAAETSTAEQTADAQTTAGQTTAGQTTAGQTTAASLGQEAFERYQRYINPVLAALGQQSGLTKTFVRGLGTRLTDLEDNNYLDFVSGFGALNLGHNHPRVVAAIQQATTEAAPGFTQSAVNPYAARLAERLVTLAPADLEMVFFSNSGAEAVEAALKLAKGATGRTGLLHCRGSYHGKTLGALSVTGNTAYQKPFTPLLPDCERIPFGDLGALRQALVGERFAAFLVEPIQGEGGMVVPPERYLVEAQALCREAGTLLLLDEIQTGMGRTGQLFACEAEQVQPDVLMLAKSLGGGLMPIGATLMRRDLWSAVYGSIDTFALHTSTFGGGSLACAAGLATLDTLQQEHLIDRARERGQQLKDGLARLVRECSLLKEVRGRGLMLGLEFRTLAPQIAAHWMRSEKNAALQYLAPSAARLVEHLPAFYTMQTLLLGHQVYTQVTRSNPNVLRIQPPLTIAAEEVDEFLQAIGRVVRGFEVASRAAETTITRSVIGKHESQLQRAVTNGELKPESHVRDDTVTTELGPAREDAPQVVVNDKA